MAASTYNLYISKDYTKGLVLESGASAPDSTDWTSVGEIDGEATFAFDEERNDIALVNIVRDLAYKAFLAVGELGEEPGKHLFTKGLPHGFTIHLADPYIQLLVTQGTGFPEEELVIKSGATVPVSSFAEVDSDNNGNGDLSALVHGIAGTATVAGTDVAIEVGPITFEEEETADQLRAASLLVLDTEGRKVTLPFTVRVLHPSTPEYAEDASAVIQGSYEHSTEMTAVAGSWSNDNSETITFKYQWLLDGEPVTGATSDKFTPTEDDVDKQLDVLITASAMTGKNEEGAKRGAKTVKLFVEGDVVTTA